MSNPGSSKHSGTVRVLTLNLWAQNAAWVDRRSVLIKGLRELNPDLVAFQEAIKTDDYDPTVDLLGSDYHYSLLTRRCWRPLMGFLQIQQRHPSLFFKMIMAQQL